MSAPPDDFITRTDLQQLRLRLESLLTAPRPAVLSLTAARALHDLYGQERGYEAVVCVEYRGLIGALLIHQKANRVFGPLVWDVAKGGWSVVDDYGLLLVLKSLLPTDV